MKTLALLCLLGLGACSDPSGPSVGESQVIVWMADGGFRTFNCARAEVMQSGNLVCYFATGGFVTMQAGTFEVRPRGH